MTRTGVCIAIVLLTGCGGAGGDKYQCRVTGIYDLTLHQDYESNVPEFVFTVEDETDTSVAGKAPSIVGKNQHGEAPFVLVSKLDGKFEGMQVQSDNRSLFYKGFCKRQ